MKQGLTQSEFARQIGMSQPQLAKIKPAAFYEKGNIYAQLNS
ncbi:helix-turn-helix transcriptional regulator [Limosilactobacillus reuteri]|nr:helix-turn-helix transcriptional regulator [Limosilactobacillus reuteri]MCC4500310.1 helix-turn-helix transcriptional regulator [Limosilactobacillus reuteri]MCC4500635.1 helix-turn-helix transcriptional regulator [Limosilactobacillus reuteri]